jgi:hypothetical protein
MQSVTVIGGYEDTTDERKERGLQVKCIVTRLCTLFALHCDISRECEDSRHNAIPC